MMNKFVGSFFFVIFSIQMFDYFHNVLIFFNFVTGYIFQGLDEISTKKQNDMKRNLQKLVEKW